MTVFWWAMISSAASPTSANSALPTTFSSIPGSCPPRWTWSLAFHNNHLSSTIWRSPRSSSGIARDGPRSCKRWRRTQTCTASSREWSPKRTGITGRKKMFGSDWPVCLLAASYQQVLEIVEEYVQDCAADVKGKIFAGNAAQFYGLKMAQHGLAD